ncbi:hypothetical protein [Deinococcus aquaticus]|uniref:hypothetical protein n=1 Tax=Deinococcus aquaticus TaxID=328692 RepID=UPI003F46DBF3
MTQTTNVQDDWRIYRNPRDAQITVPAFEGCVFAATAAGGASVTYTLAHLERRERVTNEDDLYLDEVQTRVAPLGLGDVIDHPYRGAWIATPAGLLEITDRMRREVPA